LPAQHPPDDGRLLLLAEFTLGQPALGHHWQHAWPAGRPGRGPGVRWWRWWGSGPVGAGRRGSVLRLQHRQGALQGLDRVGPLGGQVLGGSATGPLQLQGMLECSNPVINRLAGGPATRGPILLSLIGPVGLAWAQASCQQVLGRDAPEATLTGDGTWLLVGGWEAPGGQVAADRRGRDSAHLRRLSDCQARPCPRAMLGLGKLAERLLLGVVTITAAIPNRLPAAHDRSLSRSVRPCPTLARSTSCRWWRALVPRLPGSVVSATARSARRALRGRGRAPGRRP
jgi:hypothetical protein